MIKMFDKLKQKIPVIAAVIVLPLILTIAAFCIDIALASVWSFLISAAIIYALFCIVYGATGKIWAAWLTTSIPVLLLEAINFYKLRINDAPLVLSDFSLIGGFNEVVGFALPQIRITPVVISVIVGFLVLSAAIVLIEESYRKTKRTRLAVLFTGIALLLVLFVPFSHKAIVQTTDNEMQTSHQLVIRHGVIAGLYCSGVKSNNAPKMTLKRADIASVVSAYEKKEPVTDTPPTVIFLMSESFFDVYRLPGISYSQDPIPNFHKLQQDHSSGIFLSNTYCGGTGYVEMEFLTGLSSRYLNEGHTLDSLPDKKSYKYMPCINDVFKANGYTTSFIHSYNNALYNRSFIYPSFEFDNIIFDADFTVPIEYSGGYISDMSLTNQIIETYESSKGSPSMIYAISMENHQPFLKDKYPEKSGIEIYSELSEEDSEIYESFIHGLNNADKALGELIEYFSAVDEPVIITFWGDHLPNLATSDGSNIYREIGFCDDSASYNLEKEDFFNMLTTDYVIWSNFGLEKTDKPLGGPTLGVEVMERSGIEMNDYFKWLSSRMKDTYLVFSPSIFASADGEVYSRIPDKYSKTMYEYHQVIYDTVYGDHKLFGKQR